MVLLIWCRWPWKVLPCKSCFRHSIIIWFLLVIYCLLYTLQDKSFHSSLNSHVQLQLPTSTFLSYTKTVCITEQRVLYFHSIPLSQLLDYKSLSLKCSWESLLISYKGVNRSHSLVLQREVVPTVDFICWQTPVSQKTICILAFCSLNRSYLDITSYSHISSIEDGYEEVQKVCSYALCLPGVSTP